MCEQGEESWEDIVVCPLPSPLQRSINRTIADYERVGDLKFALLVWRTNLLRDTSLAVTPEEIEETLREGYYAALR